MVPTAINPLRTEGISEGGNDAILQTIIVMLELVQHNTGKNFRTAVANTRPDPSPILDGKMEHVANSAAAVVRSPVYPAAGMDKVGEEIAGGSRSLRGEILDDGCPDLVQFVGENGGLVPLDELAFPGGPPEYAWPVWTSACHCPDWPRGLISASFEVPVSRRVLDQQRGEPVGAEFNKGGVGELDSLTGHGGYNYIADVFS